MHTFRVWAPVAKQVEVQVGRKRWAMEREREGWWQAQVATARPGSDYGFLVDGGGPWPDPRSPWQPRGVNGRSRVLDHDAFRWTDARWQAPPLSSAMIYELHLGTFTRAGTFASAIAKLDHLVKLGVTHVELMPVNEFSGARGWGYDGVDLFAPHHAYGGPDGMKRFVDACHARRLAVLLDVVYNHLGPSGNYLGKFGPYFNSRYATGWGPALNFDGADSDEVRRFFCDNALMWLRDYHCDGLRLDAVHAMFDLSAEPFLEQLGAEVNQLAARLGRPLVLIAESDLNDPRVLRSPAQGGFGLDAQWSDDFHHALHAVLTGERSGYYADFGTLADLAKALRQAWVYDGRYSVYRRRKHGRPPGSLGGHRFLAYLQNHDQVGNRACGERSGRLMSRGRLKIGAALVLTAPFVPMIFAGEEWAAATPFLYFTDHHEPALAKAVSEGRRREFAAFGWRPEDVPDPQARTTFLRSKLNWAELKQPPHAALLDWHRRLLHLRRTEPTLNNGRLDRIITRFDEGEGWLAVERGPMSVVCNFAPVARRVPLRSGGHRVLLASAETLPLRDNRVVLPPDSVAVLKRKSKAVSAHPL